MGRDLTLGPGQNVWLYYDPGREAWTSFITPHNSGGLGSGLSAAGSETITGTWTFSGSPIFNPAVIVGAASTSGIRLDLESGVLAVREGDDSAYADLKALTVETTGDLTVGDQLLVSGAGPHAIGTAVNTSVQLSLSGTFTETGGIGRLISIQSTMNLAVNAQGFGLFTAPTFVEAASGTHSLIATWGMQVSTVTAGTATVTNTASCYIEGAMSATVTGANYALWSDAGLNRFDGNGTHVFELPADATDPTAGGGAAAGRIPVSIGGATKYLAYY